MHSYQTLAVLALAVSTASPAISAPIREQARAIVDDRGLSGILKTIGSGAAFGSLPLIFEDLLSGNSTRRDLNERELAIRGVFSDLLGALKNSDSIAKVFGNGLLSGTASGAAAVATTDLLSNSTRRAFALGDLEPFAKTLAGAITSLVAADGVESIFGGNSTTKREPAGILGDVADLIGEDGVALAKVLGTSLLGGFAGGAGGKIANTVLSNNTRREPGVLASVADLIGEDGVSIAKILGTGLIGGFAGGAGGKAAADLLNNTRREPSPFELGDIPGDIGGILGNLTDTADPADDIKSKIDRLLGFGLELPPRDLIDTLQHLSRRLNELD